MTFAIIQTLENNKTILLRSFVELFLRSFMWAFRLALSPFHLQKIPLNTILSSHTTMFINTLVRKDKQLRDFNSVGYY